MIRLRGARLSRWRRSGPGRLRSALGRTRSKGGCILFSPCDRKFALDVGGVVIPLQLSRAPEIHARLIGMQMCAADRGLWRAARACFEARVSLEWLAKRSGFRLLLGFDPTLPPRKSPKKRGQAHEWN